MAAGAAEAAGAAALAAAGVVVVAFVEVAVLAAAGAAVGCAVGAATARGLRGAALAPVELASVAAGVATTRGLRGAAGFFAAAVVDSGAFAAGALEVFAAGVVSDSDALSGFSGESFMWGVLLPALPASIANLHIVFMCAVSMLGLRWLLAAGRETGVRG